MAVAVSMAKVGADPGLYIELELHAGVHLPRHFLQTSQVLRCHEHIPHEYGCIALKLLDGSSWRAFVFGHSER
jgi:hypothetical protein